MNWLYMSILKALGLAPGQTPALPTLPAATGSNDQEQETALSLKKKQGYRPLFGPSVELSGRAGTILTGPSGDDSRKTLLGA